MDRMMKKLSVTLVLLICLAFPALSSHEGALPISEFTFRSEGISGSGIIIVEGKTDGRGIFSKLSVEAFGKTFDVSGETLKRFPIRKPNGIQLSYEGGYKETGGRTVYVNFILGMWKQHSKSVFTLVVNEDGKQEIYIRQP